MTRGASGTSKSPSLRRNGFNGNVSLSASGLPSGVSASFKPQQHDKHEHLDADGQTTAPPERLP